MRSRYLFSHLLAECPLIGSVLLSKAAGQVGQTLLTLHHVLPPGGPVESTTYFLSEYSLIHENLSV